MTLKRRAGIHIVYPEVAFIRENYQFRSVIELHAIRAFLAARRAGIGWPTCVRGTSACATWRAARRTAADLNSIFMTLDSDMHVSFVAALENRAISAAYARIMDNINLARQVHDQTVAADARPGHAGRAS